jgi:flagellar FliL protein
VFKVENIIVNPAGCEGTRFLMASVAFELPDEKVEARLRDHDFMVRDAVIGVLENQPLEALTRAGARDSLKRQLAEAILPLAGRHLRLRVFLPQFVIQ